MRDLKKTVSEFMSSRGYSEEEAMQVVKDGQLEGFNYKPEPLNTAYVCFLHETGSIGTDSIMLTQRPMLKFAHKSSIQLLVQKGQTDKLVIDKFHSWFQNDSKKYAKY